VARAINHNAQGNMSDVLATSTKRLWVAMRLHMVREVCLLAEMHTTHETWEITLVNGRLNQFHQHLHNDIKPELNDPKD